MTFCITTPIYYINGDPHIGHAYTSIAADVIARFKRMDGMDVHFSTGTDEHGIKVARSAEKAGLDPKDFSDLISEKFLEMSNEIKISYDDFIRTTEERHEIASQALWKLMEKDIYKSTYSGWYSARDEEYVAAGDIIDGKTIGGAPVEWVEEESYFFKLSDYQDALLKYYENNPDFISPKSRQNEVISFVKRGLKDLSISRSQFKWGIKVPQPENAPADSMEHVMYVWVDALTNYITSMGFPNSDVNPMMKNCVHIVGKEILRFHAVYWPAFLMSAGINLPKKIFAHGWWVSNGQKMSKSIGNVIKPEKIIKKYGLDSMRYFLLREIKFGEDGDFSDQAIKKRIKYDLSNDLGNLVHRVLSFVQKRSETLSVNQNYIECDFNILNKSKNLLNDLRNMVDKYHLSSMLTEIWELIAESNKYVNDMRPWELAKTDPNRLNTVITLLCENIRIIAYAIAPFMPDTAEKIFGFLNIPGKHFSELSEPLKSFIFSEQYLLFPKELYE